MFKKVKTTSFLKHKVTQEEFWPVAIGGFLITVLIASGLSLLLRSCASSIAGVM